jgi:hypothetical protein
VWSSFDHYIFYDSHDFDGCLLFGHEN